MDIHTYVQVKTFCTSLVVSGYGIALIIKMFWLTILSLAVVNSQQWKIAGLEMAHKIYCCSRQLTEEEP